MQTSKKINNVLKKVKNIQEIFNKVTPFLPKAFPNKPVTIQLTTGKKRGNKYIKRSRTALATQILLLLYTHKIMSSGIPRTRPQLIKK